MAYVHVVFSKPLLQAPTHPLILQAAGGFCLQGYDRSQMNRWNFSSDGSRKGMQMKGVT